MRRKLLVVVAVLVTALATTLPTGAATGTGEIPTLPSGVPLATDLDNTPSPMAVEMAELRTVALEAQTHGKDNTNAEGVARVGRHRGKYRFVELEREDEDLIWTVLGEFGPQDSPHGPGSPFGDLTSGIPGPLHNEIPEPNRRFDNSTIWRSDFDRDYYQELLFASEKRANSMRNYYIEQSSGRYAVDGDVTDWGLVPYNAAHYGRDWCGSIVCATTWWFVQDSVTSWYDAQIAAGQTAEEIDAYLSQFDVWDRYDHDLDGNFDEPDGYIDTSNRSMPAPGRRRVAELKAQTPSGATGGMCSSPRSGRVVPPSTTGPSFPSAEHGWEAANTGSAITPSSRRTGGWVCSPTSSPTTWACPTCTTCRATPAARRVRTQPASGL